MYFQIFMPDDKQTKNQYISLKEAAKTSSYSQEYLSLRARQGKLRAIKIGRNWTTTQEWLDEYIAKVEDATRRDLYLETKVVSPPENLPTKKEEIPVLFRPKKASFFPSVRVGFAVATILLFVFGGAAYGKDGVYELVENANKAVQALGDNVQQVAVEVALSLGDDMKHLAIGIQAEIIDSVNVIPDGIDELSNGFDHGAPIALRHLELGIGEFVVGLKSGMYKPVESGKEAAEYLLKVSPQTFSIVDESIKRGVQEDSKLLAQAYGSSRIGFGSFLKKQMDRVVSGYSRINTKIAKGVEYDFVYLHKNCGASK